MIIDYGELLEGLIELEVEYDEALDCYDHWVLSINSDYSGFYYFSWENRTYHGGCYPSPCIMETHTWQIDEDTLTIDETEFEHKLRSGFTWNCYMEGGDSGFIRENPDGSLYYNVNFYASVHGNRHYYGRRWKKFIYNTGKIEDYMFFQDETADFDYRAYFYLPNDGLDVVDGEWTVDRDPYNDWVWEIKVEKIQ